MARLIFIFPILLINFLIIVSKSTFSVIPDRFSTSQKSHIFELQDTLNSIFYDDFENCIY